MFCAAVLTLLAPARMVTADVVSFQEGANNTFIAGYAATDDNQLMDPGTGFGNANIGGRNAIQVGDASSITTRRAILRFGNLGVMSGAFSSIDSARIVLTKVNGPTGGGTDGMEMYAISDTNAGWVEGTGQFVVQAGSSSWDFTADPAPWIGGGGGGALGPLQDTLPGVSGNDAGGTIYSFDLDPALVTQWINGGTNAGVVIKELLELDGAGSGTDLQIELGASEFGDLADRPRLEITYTPDTIPSTPGLAAWWKFDEGTGNFLGDCSSNANHGLIINGSGQAPIWTSVGGRKALVFDGDDYIDCGNGPSLNITGNITLEAWVRPEASSAFEPVIAGKYFDSYTMTYFYPNAGAYWYVDGFAHSVRVSAPLLDLPGNSPGLGWYHLVATFDGTQMKFYVNAEVGNTRTISGSIPASSEHFYIGGVWDPGVPGITSYFKGLISDVRVYSHVLTEAEIEAHFQEGTAEFGFTAPYSDIVEVPANTLSDTNGLVVKVGTRGELQVDGPAPYESYIVETYYSFPDSTIGWNALSSDQSSSEAGWTATLSVSKTLPSVLEVGATGTYYALHRTVEIVNGKVEFDDRLTNLDQSSVGIFVWSKITTEDPYVDVSTPQGAENPSMFLSSTGSCIGVHLEDNFSRMHYDPVIGLPLNQALFRIRDMALDVGTAHTLEWTLYPFPANADPFSFANRVRADWGTNFTVDGPYAYFDSLAGGGSLWMPWQDPDQLKAYLTRRRLGLVAILPFLDYDPGSADHVWSRAEYTTNIAPVISAIKAADPNVKCLGSVETDWITIYPDQITGGDQLPQASPSNPAFEIELTPAQTQIILDADLPWEAGMHMGVPYKTSYKKTKAGNLTLELYTRGGVPQTAVAVYPEIGNYQYQFMLDQLDFLLNDMGLDGVFIDQFSMINSTTRTYGQWDGLCAEIDPGTGGIVPNSECVDANLSGIGARVNLCQYVLDRDKIVVANTYSTSREEQALPVNRVSETWNAFDPLAVPTGQKPPIVPLLLRGALASPIALGVGNGVEGQEAVRLMKAIISYLRHGLLYYHYIAWNIPESGPGNGEYGPINNMFPMTPVELNQGWISGEERTVTCVSGDFEWPHPSKPRVLVYDEEGRFQTTDYHYTMSPSAGGWTVSLLIDDWSDICIMCPDSRVLTVESTPVPGVAVAAAPLSSSGVTGYEQVVTNGHAALLTAPLATTNGATAFHFVRWVLESEPGLVAGYPLDEGVGTVVRDSSGYHADGEVTGAGWVLDGGWWSLDFDGTDDIVNCGNSAALDVSDSFSVALWMKPHPVPLGGVVGVVGKEIERYSVAYNNDNNQVTWYIGDGANSLSAGVSAGQWNHVVATFDGATMKLFVNNGSPASKSSAYSSIDAGGELTFGHLETFGYFKGRITDVRVYDRALSGADVSALFAAVDPGWKPSMDQPLNQTTVNVTLSENTRAIAEYSEVRVANVRSTPVAGVAIAGTPPTMSGMTDYIGSAADGAAVTLTAPASVSTGGIHHAFLRWVLERDPGLVAGYGLNEGVGSIAGDSSGYQTEGQIVGAGWTQDSGRSVLDFDGIDDLIHCGNSAALDVTDSFSIAVWMKPEQVVSNGEVGVAGKEIERFTVVYNNTNNRAYWYIGAGWNNLSAQVNTGQWNHVVATLDGTTMKLYVNNAPSASKTSSFPSIATGGELRIGDLLTFGHFKGRIAGVRVYNRGLSAGEVSTQYAAGVAGWVPREEQPLQDPILTFTLDDPTKAIAEYEIAPFTPGTYLILR
jgi:hypothetical protein